MTKSEYFTLFAVVFLVFAILILAVTIPNHTQEIRMLEDAALNGERTAYTPKWVGGTAALLYGASGSLILLSSIFIVISIKSRDR